MNYIVMDLEWNQCPNGKADEVKELPFEIFDIGAVKLDENRQIIDTFSCLVKPQVYMELHYIAKGLTHANMNELKKGRPFPEVAKEFIEWCGKDFRVCTWGPSDLVELQRNLKFYGMENPFEFPLFYYDVQKMFSIDIEDGKIRRSLETAVDMLQIKKTIEFHTAASDAMYTAKVMQHLNLDMVGNFYSIDTYNLPTDAKSEIRVNYGTYEKYITAGYDSRDELLASNKLIGTKCYICGKAARKKIRWFTVNSKMHYCLAECKEHGYIRGKFKIREDEHGKFYATRVLKVTDEAGAEEIKLRQLETRKKRHDRRHKKKSNN